MPAAMRILLLIGLLLVGKAGPVLAATPQESRAFTNAAKYYADNLYPFAERAFTDFVFKYPNSDLRAEAVLYEAKARFAQTNFSGTIDLLQSQLPQAGNLADQYYFWLGETHFTNGNFQAAAENYGEVIRNWPQSPLRLPALCNQAFSHARMGEWSRVIDLLQKPEGEFQRAARELPGSEHVIRGKFLLVEALLSGNRWAEAEKVVLELEPVRPRLDPDSQWRQQYLLGKIQAATGRSGLALQNITNLFVAANASGRRTLVAETVNLQGQILENLRELPLAVQTYEKNLGTNLPVEIRRQALLKTIDLTLAQDKVSEAVRLLENFVSEHTNDVVLDLARLTLGELQLKEYFSPSPNRGTNTTGPEFQTNLLERAATNLNRVIVEFPKSPYLPKAFLARGWCRWAAGNWEAARADFQVATERLPVSEEQAVARFKLADARFKLSDYAGALSDYGLVLERYGQLPAVRSALFDQALYQIVRSALAAGNREASENALKKILDWYPNSYYSDRATLLAGQDLNRRGSPVEARKLFLDFLRQFPGAALAPEIRLAVAQTWLQESQWNEAIDAYAQWLVDFPAHLLAPRAEFSRAMALLEVGRETNAVASLTNFVARYPANELAPLAQNCVADFYWNHDDFQEAEKNYQLVRKFNPSRELSARAWFMAGRSAYARQGINEARDYFSQLVSDTNTPPTVVAESWSALGDAIFEQFLVNTNKLPNEAREGTFVEAISAFNHVVNDFPKSPLVPRAWGRIGDCHRQWALLKQDNKAFKDSLNAYSNVLSAAQSEPSLRAEASVAIGDIHEKLLQPKAALESYARVFYAEDDGAGAFWMSEAGQGAARVCESQGEFDQAIKIYQRLLNRFPALRPALDRKIDAARQHLESAKK